MSNEHDPIHLARALASVADYEQQAAARVREHGPQLRQPLKACKVARVVADYEGCGDSGSLETLRFLSAAEVEATPPLDGPLQDAVQDDLYDLLEARQPGWENNDGAFGEFVWDLEADTLEHQHHARFSDVSTTIYENFEDLVGSGGEA